MNLCASFGTVPKIPNPLLGNDDENIEYMGNLNQFSKALEILGKKYNRQDWMNVSIYFKNCGYLINQIKDILVDYCINVGDQRKMIPQLFKEIGILCSLAYTEINNYNNQG